MDENLKNKINQLSPEQLKALMKKLGKNKKEMPLMPRNEAQEYPASSAQRRMWFLSKMDPDSYLYTNPVAIRIFSTLNLDFDRYLSGVELISQQHEILRTSFFSRDGKVFQKIHPKVPIRLNKIDIRELAEDEKEERLLEILKEDGQNTIDVEDFPLFRFTEVVISDQESSIIYTSHHIISDAWSSTQIYRTLHDLSLKDPPITELPKLKYQFIDHVLWEENWLKGEGYKKALNEIKSLIPTAPEPLELPLDYKRPEVISYNGGLEKAILDPELVDRINNYCKKENVNQFHYLLATFNVLLHKYSLANEISVGIPLANRKLKEFQETVGMFLNTLPLVTNIDEKRSFYDHLKTVKAAGEKLVAHQDLPFDKLIDELNPERSLSYSPLFQVLFVFQNIPQMYERENLRIAPVKSDYAISKYDLDLWIEEVGDTMYLSLTYKSNLFKKESIKRFLDRYIHLLHEVLKDPQQSIENLQLEDQHKPERIDEVKIEASSYLDGFEKQVRSDPNAIALIFDNTEWTFQELNEKADQLAHYIGKQNTSSPYVGIALERSAEQIISILAIHKAGLAYVPIDVDRSEKYIEFILEDTQLDLLISSNDHQDKFNGIRIISPNEKGINDQLKEDLKISVNKEDLAYVMYTSGTSGKPKGVTIAHQQLLNYSSSVWKRIDLEADNVFGSVSAISTDLGNTQIFPPLMHGAALNLIRSELITSPTELANYLKKKQIDCLKIVPSHLNSMLNGKSGFDILPKKLLILGGEKVTTDLILKIKEKRKDLRIINHYGPTESTIGILTHEISDIAENDIIPIGKPLDNNAAFIVDHNNKVVADGLKGEILICGDNVSEGYLNNPALSEKQFGDRFNDINKPYYKTGDLGRVDNNGNIQFLGRIDRQFKVRGYRVELDAIEKLIQDHEDVIENRILVQANSMLAFVKVKPSTSLSTAKIELSLSSQLPSYMVPESIILVDEIPRLGNGKVDEKKLAQLVVQKEDLKLIEEKPRDEIELFIAQVWREVLDLGDLSIHDDFFKLGGNSLSAIEIFDKINRRFSTQLGIATLFHSKTIAKLAHQVINAGAERENSSVVMMRKGTSNLNLFLVHPAGGDIMSYYELAQVLDDSFNVYGLQSVIATDKDTTIEEASKSYLKAIEETNIDGSYFFGGWSMGAVIAFEMAKQYHDHTKNKVPVILLDQKAPASKEYGLIEAADDLERLAVFGGKIDHIVGHKTQLTKENLAPLNESERTELFLQEFKKHNLVTDDINANDFQIFLDRMMVHHDMALDYRTDAFDVDLLLIKAKDSTFVTDEFENDLCYGWSNYSTNEMEIMSVSGNHITIMKQPNATEVAVAIQNYVDKIKGNEPNLIEPQEVVET